MLGSYWIILVSGYVVVYMLYALNLDHYPSISICKLTRTYNSRGPSGLKNGWTNVKRMSLTYWVYNNYSPIVLYCVILHHYSPGHCIIPHYLQQHGWRTISSKESRSNQESNINPRKQHCLVRATSVTQPHPYNAELLCSVAWKCFQRRPPTKNISHLHRVMNCLQLSHRITFPPFLKS